MKLFGKNPVIERLRANPKSIRHIYLQEGVSETAYICKKARHNGIPVFIVPASKMLKIGRTRNTQGVLGDVLDFEYVPYDELLESAVEKRRSLLFLDGLNDPQNLGAILRSLACLGKFSVVLPRHDCVDITETVMRVSSGGENYVPVAKVANLGQAIKSAKESGFTIAGAVVKGGENLWEAAFKGLMGLVIGSEQKGIREVNRNLLDLELTIPMALGTLSLNVAQAAAILCYEITRQKKIFQAEKKEGG